MNYWIRFSVVLLSVVLLAGACSRESQQTQPVVPAHPVDQFSELPNSKGSYTAETCEFSKSSEPPTVSGIDDATAC
jgi:hypothetical protein